MPKTLLLADDSVTIQKVVGISFANEDIAITTVDNGRDAVTKARAMKPDIILADVVMPGMSGYEVCEAVKADPNLRHIPVLLLTGTFEAFDQARASAVGAAGHVAKPFEAQTLVDRVKQLLASAAATVVRTAPARPAAPSAAAAPVAATPAPAMRAADPADDAFDFFSETPEVPQPPAAHGAAASDAFDLEEPDAAFAFGDDDLAPEIPAARPAQRGDSTVAILPEPPGPAARAEAFDFSFEGDATDEPFEALGESEPIDPGRVSHSTLLDPDSASEYDVSSSDLSASFARGPAAATKVLAVDLDTPVPGADPDLDITEPDSFAMPTGAYRGRTSESASFERDVFDREVAFEAEPVMMGEPLAAEDEVALEPVPAPMVAEPVPASAPFVARPVAEDPFAAEPWDDDDSFPGPVAERPAAAPAPVATAVSPEMRAEMRDTLEKIAWDAFAPVTEKIVREALERVEQVVWEVVPKLAESLIQEEIRRLKGDS
jgi:CheY-like chemotaxis protein